MLKDWKTHTLTDIRERQCPAEDHQRESITYKNVLDIKTVLLDKAEL